MSSRWFYSHADVTAGPFTEVEMKRHIARGMLIGRDFVWREGEVAALQADSVFDFPAPAPVVPDWLSDVAEAESKSISATLVAGTEVPDWLEDLNLWITLEQAAPSRPADKPTIEIAATAPSAGVPDWLQDWLTPESPKETTPPPVIPSVPLGMPASPAKSPVSKVPPAVPVAPAKPVASVPIAPPVAPPSPAPTVADRVREATGYDADTGRIVDPEKFARWKQQHARTGPAPVSNASLFEVFRKGRLAIEGWVDDEQNRPCILHADAAEVQRQAGVQAILQQYANYGKDLQEKLVRHLEFMVENRRKYYQAISERY